MHIIHIVHSYYPGLGGIERAVQYLTEEQAKLGHEVTVVTSNVNVSHRPRQELINGVRIIRVKAFKLLYNDLIIPVKEPAINDANVIHAHSQNSLFSLVMAERLKKELGGKVAFYFMAVNAFKDHPNALIRILAPYYGGWTVKKALKISDLVLVKSHRDEEVLMSRYGVKATYVPDGIPSYYFTMRRRDSESFREKFAINQENIFLFIGRLHKLKGPDVLVKALRYIDNRDVAVVFIGPDTAYKKQLINLVEKLGVKDRVYLLGYLTEEDKIHAIDSSVAVVLPSISDYVEVYPMVISEAWARGKPVIASSVGGIPYRVKNYENGILVKPLDPVSLAKAMNLIMERHNLAKKLGEKGRNEVKSWTKITKVIINLYENLL